MEGTEEAQPDKPTIMMLMNDLVPRQVSHSDVCVCVFVRVGVGVGVGVWVWVCVGVGVSSDLCFTAEFLHSQEEEGGELYAGHTHYMYIHVVGILQNRI